MRTLLHCATSGKKACIFHKFPSAETLCRPVASIITYQKSRRQHMTLFQTVILNGFNDVAFQFEHQTSLSTLSAIFIKQDYCSTQRSAMAGDNRQTVISKKSILWAWWEKISAEILRINMPLENHSSVYYVTSFLCRTRTPNTAYECLVWLCVGLCVIVVMGGFKRLTENSRQVRDRRLRWGGVGWHNE